MHPMNKLALKAIVYGGGVSALAALVYMIYLLAR